MNRAGGVRVWLAVAALVATPALAHAQEQFGQPPNTYTTWSTSPQQRVDVTYFIGAGLSGAQVTLIQQAAAVWNSAGTPLTLVEVGVQAGSNIQWSASAMGLTPWTVSFAAPPTPGPGTYPDGNPWATLNGPAQIAVNSLFITPAWNGTLPAPGPLSIDFQFAALDLFGRALGLGFAASGDTTSVMQPDSTISFATPGPHSLSSSDVGALQAIYGAPEPSTLALLGIGLAVIGASAFFRRATLGL